MYAVEIYNKGKYDNIEGTFRLFLTKKNAIKFSNLLDKIECKHQICKVKRITEDCFSSVYPYHKEINMTDYECHEELSSFKLAILKKFKIYDREILYNYFKHQNKE